MPLRILSIGTDARLTSVRNSLLQSQGHRVSAVSNRHAAILTVGATHYDLAIVCHSIPLADAQKLARDIRIVAPRTEVLCLGEWEHVGLDEIRSPEFLLDVVQSCVPHPPRRVGPQAA